MRDRPDRLSPEKRDQGGLAEVPIVFPPAAVANAVSHAIGVRVTSLPISPPNLFKLMRSARQ
jgi:CO/xanthine dehydrogenase Mo-binding subunit